MNFLTDARVHALDNVLSEENQSLLVEAIFWTVCYFVYANGLSRLLRSISSRLPWWELAKKRGGVFCANGQDDSILFIAFAIHHGTAGALMMYGVIHDDPIIWRHGYLLETGLEIADTLALVLNLYPYRYDGVKPEIKVASIFHHLPGIVLSAFVLEAGLHYNKHMRAIGMWLLLGGCESCIGGLYIYSLDFDTQMTQAAIAYVINIFFFFYCRMIVFPREAYLLIQDVSNEYDNPLLLKLLYFGGICMGIFNLGIVADVVPKAIRYCKRALDGVTPIEVEPVPKSREDRMKRRRSSIGMVIDAVDEVMDAVDEVVARRRSSFETVMHLNAVEDVARMNREQEENGHFSEDDLAALSTSIASMNGKCHKVD